MATRTQGTHTRVDKSHSASLRRNLVCPSTNTGVFTLCPSALAMSFLMARLAYERRFIQPSSFRQRENRVALGLRVGGDKERPP